MLFVDGFEDTEAVATLDVLRRGGDNVDCVSLMESKTIEPKYSAGYICDFAANSIDFDIYDALILPGGPGSFKIMPGLKIVESAIKHFMNNNKLVAAICAAPHLIGKLGYFKNRSFTVHPGFENYCLGGNYMRNCGVVQDGNIITAKSMYYSIEFGLKIHEYLHGKDSKEILEASLKGE